MMERHHLGMQGRNEVRWRLG